MTATNSTAPKLRLEEITRQGFDSLQGSVFLFQPPAGPDGINPGPFAMELVEVTAYRRQEPGKRRLRPEPFSLVFRSILKRPLAHALHTVIHDACEPGPIFVSRIQPPAGADPGEVYYEAAFN